MPFFIRMRLELKDFDWKREYIKQDEGEPILRENFYVVHHGKNKLTLEKHGKGKNCVYSLNFLEVGGLTDTLGNKSDRALFTNTHFVNMGNVKNDVWINPYLIDLYEEVSKNR